MTSARGRRATVALHRRPDGGGGPAPAWLAGHRPGTLSLARPGRRQDLPRAQRPARARHHRGREEIRHLAAWQGDGGLRTPSGRWVARTGAAAHADRFGNPLGVLHRATLLDRLAARLPEGAGHTAAEASLVDPGDTTHPARVRTPDGDLDAELVVGADGIRSGVRGALFPRHPGPVHSGFTTWRIDTRHRKRASPRTRRGGRGRIWGTQPFKDGRVYAYARRRRPREGAGPGRRKRELLRRYGGDWHDPIPGIIDAARPQDVLRHEVHHIAEALRASLPRRPGRGACGRRAHHGADPRAGPTPSVPASPPTRRTAGPV